MAIERYSIPHRWQEAPVWTGEVEFADGDDASIRLGKAVVAAHRDGARLDGASLDGARLDGARWGAGATYGDGVLITRAPVIITGLYWTALIFDAHMKIGCELHALADWAAFDDRRIAQMDGLSALKFWRANKEPLLALAKANGREWVEPAKSEAA